MVPQKKITCAVCGETFWGYKNRKYCSEECYNEAHRKQARERFRIRYYVTHREAELERQHKRYRANPERKKATNMAWEQKNAEHRREYKHNWYLARKEAAAQ